MTKITPSQREALRQAAQQATPGEWQRDDTDVVTPDKKGNERVRWDQNQGKAIPAGHDPYHLAHLHDNEYIYNSNAENDAAFIVAAQPRVVLALLDYIEELEQQSRDRFAELIRCKSSLGKAQQELDRIREALL